MCASYYSRRRFLMSAGAAVTARIVAAETSSDRHLTANEVEDFLRDGRVVKTRDLGIGVTNSTRATLQFNGVTHDAHVQCVNESKAQFQTISGTELNFRDCWMFNVAAYRLDAMLGLNMTPPSVSRGWSGKGSAFTWWISDAMMEGERKKRNITPPDPHSFNQQMYVVRVFDQLVFNTDRNLQNLLITPDWKLWMIDHTRAFRLRKDLAAPNNLAKCDRTLLAKMRSLEFSELKHRMGDYVRVGEIDGILSRRDRIVSLFESKVAQHGEDRVLFDMPQRRPQYRVPPPKAS
jgi:hypothetical protein